jgi:hypothetical protein
MTPTNLTTYDSSGNITFNTDFKYIKTTPSGNMQLTTIAASPVVYANDAYNVNVNYDTGNRGGFSVYTLSGITVMTAAGNLTSGFTQYATYAFPCDGNLIFGPSTYVYSVGTAGPYDFQLYYFPNPSWQPLYAYVYSGSRYLGALRFYMGYGSSSDDYSTVSVEAFTVYWRSDANYYNNTGVLHSVPVYKGETMWLYRPGAVEFPYSNYPAQVSAGYLPGTSFRFLFNSGSTTIPLAVTT